MLQATAFCLVLLVAPLTSFSLFSTNGCQLPILELSPQPVIVTPNRYEFLYPPLDADHIALQSNEEIIISCPGGTFSVNNNSKTYAVAEAFCIKDTRIEIAGSPVDFREIRCSRNPFHTARYTGLTCAGSTRNREIEIGFVLNENVFVRQILLCFDTVRQNAVYSAYNLTKYIGAHQSGVARISFIQDDFYAVQGTTVNNLYVRNNQRATINKLLGLPADSQRYVQDSNDFYLARGHLTAKADFVFAPQQLATFHYVNVAPQWQVFNGGNWNQAEMDVRTYADLNLLDLVVYTGTYGVARLPHAETGEDTELYLYTLEEEESRQGLPVPQLFWKVVYDPDSKKGVALLGVNNPYINDVTSSIICEDISHEIDWLNWKADDVELGYSYACRVEDLKRMISFAPELEVMDLLV